jgi:hypothetical protein
LDRKKMTEYLKLFGKNTKSFAIQLGIITG